MAGELEQVIFGGDNTNSTQPSQGNLYSALQYTPSQFWSDGDPIDSSTGNTFQASLFTIAGTIKNFRIHMDSAPTAPKPITFTFYKNGISTGISITINNPDDEGSDLVSTISVVAGDVVSIRYTQNSTAQTQQLIWTATFVSSDAYKSNHCGTVTGDFTGDNFEDDTAYTLSGVLDDETDCYGSLVGGSTPSSHDNRFIVCPGVGTIKNWYLNVSIAPGSGKSYTFTLRKNGVDTALTVIISDSNKSANNTSDSVSVVEGDLLSWKCTPANLPNGDSFNTTMVNTGFTFESPVAGQYPVFQNTTKVGVAVTQNTPTDRYFSGYDLKASLASLTFLTDEVRKSQLANECTIKKMVIRLSTAPGVGKSRQFTLYKNASSTALDLTISGTDTTGTISSDVSVADNDQVYTHCILTSSPAKSWESISYLVEDLVDHTIPRNKINGATFKPYRKCGFVREATISTLDVSHLEGQKVGIMANGNFLGFQRVINNAIILDQYYSHVIVGLPYVSDLSTLNIEVQTKEGTLVGRKTLYSNVTFRVIKSLGGSIGPSEDKLYEAFSETDLARANLVDELDAPIGDDTVPKLYTTDIRKPLGSQYKGSRVFYRQTKPFPITIGSITPEVTIPSQNV